MKIKPLTLVDPDFPEVLRNIPTPPSLLYVAGDTLQDMLKRPCITVVGSRKVSAYGRAVTQQLVTELARAGVVIVSGLAIGVDSIAHQAALDAGGATIAVLPSGLEAIYPARHLPLARQIIERGGALITEYPPQAKPHQGAFIARNRIAAGLSEVTLITEAATKSGTLHTATFALEQGRAVMAVPGNITSPTSGGTNTLIKNGALVATSTADILQALGIQASQQRRPLGATPAQQTLLDLIAQGETDGEALLVGSGLEVPIFNQSLTMLEITGKVRALGNNQWAIA